MALLQFAAEPFLSIQGDVIEGQGLADGGGEDGGDDDGYGHVEGGGSFEQICFAVKNMIANLTGMICDGAKPGCSLKLSSGVGTAMLSAMLAMQNSAVSSVEGIIDEDVDRSIHNLTSIGREAMQETNRMVVDIMTRK